MITTMIAAETELGSPSIQEATATETEVEQVARRIQTMRNNRIAVPFSVRKRLLRSCRKIAKKTNRKSRIGVQDLIKLRDEVKEEVESQENKAVRACAEALGFRNEAKLLLRVLDRAVDRVTCECKGDFFDYQEFAFYNTILESQWPWMRSPLLVSFGIIFLFYVFSPIFWCLIVSDDNICPNNGDGDYAGWLTVLYFASETMSTVGYGDVTIMGDGKAEDWRMLMGILYMLFSMVILVTAFSAAANRANEGNPLDMLQAKLIELFSLGTGKETLLYKRIRRIYAVKISHIIMQFTIVNLVGLFIARIFISGSDLDYSWMTTLYWTVQTTTTIGYGDVPMPFDMRWFQIFYMVVATYCVGDSLGRLGSLQKEVEEVETQYAWESREVSEGMLEDMQADDHDGKIDQYEFVVASLLALDKISTEDVTPIMDRFRSLAGGDGYISMRSNPDETERVDLELGDP